MLVLLIGFLSGVITVILVQYFTLNWIFKLSPKHKPPRPPPYTPPTLPPDLSQNSYGPYKEETCQWVNFCGAFLFQELRESNLVKKAVITKLNEEFKEFLLKKTTGQLLHQVTVRDYFLGDSLPQVNCVRVLKVRRDDKEELLTEVTVGFDVDYKGAALIAIDADILLGKSFSVTVELVRLAGKVRLQFSREPYTHWSMSFMREPLIEIRIAPEFQGRNVSQLITPIEKLIHRFIRKKHTLPNYKVRRSPLFPKLVPQSANVQLYMHDASITEGILEVDILGCSRLLEIPEAKRAFCTAAITDKQWKPLNKLVRPANGPMLNLTIDKTHGMEHGITFQRYQDQEMELNCIVVSDVVVGSPSYKAGVMKGDFVFFINGVEVKSVSKAKSLIETMPSSSFILTVQRFFSSHASNSGPVQVNEPVGSVKQMNEFDPEISSLLGTYIQAPDSATCEEKDRNNSVISEKGDTQGEKEYAARGFPDDFPNTDLCPDQQQRTKYNYYSRHIPAFPDKLTFNIMPEHKYLSIVLWYDSPEITDAALAGHITIPLCDIAVECIATSSGRHTQRYVLVPVNPLRPGMSKTHARQIASANDQVSKPWIAPGVANKQAQFAGDILLCFSHTPKHLRREDKPEYTPWSRHIALAKARQREKKRDGILTDEIHSKHIQNGVSPHTEELESSYDALATDPETQTLEDNNNNSKPVHNFMTITTFNQGEHDTCKLCYGDLKSETVSKCQLCSLICHQRCSLNANQKIVCNQKIKGKVTRSAQLIKHQPLELIEAGAERVLLSIPPINELQTDIVPDTSRFQGLSLADRITSYREHILMLKHNLDTHEEVVNDLKHQLSSPCPPENLKPIKFQLSNTEDKQRAIATLLLQYCEGLKLLECGTGTESGSEPDD